MLKFTALFVVLCATFHVALSITDGLLPNGNFEQGPKPSQMKGTKVTDPTAIPNWQLSGVIEYIKSGQKQGDMLLIVPEGQFAVRLGNEASIRQKLKVTKGMFYSVTFSAARTCAQEERLNVSVRPNTEAKDWGMLPMQTMYSSDGWDSYAWGFLAEASEVEVSIHNPGVEEDAACGPLLDSVALKALPPPPRRTRGNMLKNGNFEHGPYVFPNTSWGVLVPSNIEDDHCPLLGWMVESLKAVKYIDSDHFSVPEGRASDRAHCRQRERHSPSGQNHQGQGLRSHIFLGVPYESKGKGGFKQARLRFVAVSDRTRVRFLSSFYTMKNDNSGSLCGPVIDDVKLLGVRNPN
ncbi:transmembrane protein, putative [Actinidia rufa]|uniref:Transmembrane protein, putative n=1 Tax=Actinidia rufa TaxID=165716 RepID=A0A7J0GLX5_9ERIC|nr:transmembrane protein, putative [Actinidia rufa]